MCKKLVLNAKHSAIKAENRLAFKKGNRSDEVDCLDNSSNIYKVFNGGIGWSKAN